MVKNGQKSSSMEPWADSHETWYVALGTPAHGKVKFGNLGFSIGKVKTVDFSKTIAACDLKVGRCRQLIEIMKVREY